MDPFIIKWLISFLVGSFWVIISTLVAEKISGELGGLIVGLPSTAVVSLLFITLTQGIDAALIASIVLPLTSGLYSFFFLTYLTQVKKNFFSGLTKSLIVWFIIAFIAYKLPVNHLFTSTVIWFTLITLSIRWTAKNIHIDHKLIPKKIISSPLWIKALLSGLIISTVVLIGKLAGPIWAGIFATFPAVTFSTLLLTEKSGGVEFTRLIAKNNQFSITTTLGLYAILVYFSFPIFGAIVGTIISYLILLLISFPLYRLVFDKLKE